MKTNHVQRGLAYCYFINDIVEVPGPHVEDVCLGRQCPYLNGSAQGEGIECLWDDGSDEPFTVDEAPSVLQGMAEEVGKRDGGFA